MCLLLEESSKFFETFKTLLNMAYANRKMKKGSKFLIHGAECELLAFKINQAIAELLDPIGAQSKIPSQVLLVHDICSYYYCSIQELGTHEMHEALNELSMNGALKLEHRHLEEKGLTHIFHMPRDFLGKMDKIHFESYLK